MNIWTPSFTSSLLMWAIGILFLLLITTMLIAAIDNAARKNIYKSVFFILSFVILISYFYICVNRDVKFGGNFKQPIEKKILFDGDIIFYKSKVNY